MVLIEKEVKKLGKLQREKNNPPVGRKREGWPQFLGAETIGKLIPLSPQHTLKGGLNYKLLLY